MRIINAFLESLVSRVLSPSGSHSPPYLPRMPSNTVLISGPAMGAAQILIWSYSKCVLASNVYSCQKQCIFFCRSSQCLFIYSIDTESA